ncbi:MAG: hypothetical protein WBW94_00340 [Anaerolineales bacterium]
MKIMEYQYQDAEDKGWKFNNVKLSNINLIVGDTASGKTRFLNTIFNLGEFVKGTQKKSGKWKITFQHKNKTYSWELVSELSKDLSKERVAVIKDYLWKHNGSKLEPLIERDRESFLFKGQKMPKLSQSETSIGLLKEDDDIKPIYEAFSILRHRLFSVEGFNKASEIASVKPNQYVAKNLSEKQILRDLFNIDLGVNACMFLIRKYDSARFFL